jgi:hypothetical protein
MPSIQTLFKVHPSVDLLIGNMEFFTAVKQSPGDKAPLRKINTNSFVKDRSL